MTVRTIPLFLSRSLISLSSTRGEVKPGGGTVRRKRDKRQTKVYEKRYNVREGERKGVLCVSEREKEREMDSETERRKGKVDLLLELEPWNFGKKYGQHKD